MPPASETEDYLSIFYKAYDVWKIKSRDALSNEQAELKELAELIEAHKNRGITDTTIKERFQELLPELWMIFRKLPYGADRYNAIMDTALTKGYEAAGAPRFSGPSGFKEFVVARDLALGLPARVDILSHVAFRYSIKDMYWRLLNKIDETEYQKISTDGYLATKMRYFLGGKWYAKLTGSPWKTHSSESPTIWIIKTDSQ